MFGIGIVELLVFGALFLVLAACCVGSAIVIVKTLQQR